MTNNTTQADAISTTPENTVNTPAVATQDPAVLDTSAPEGEKEEETKKEVESSK